MGEVDFNQSWESLADALREIQHKNASTLSFEELYRKSYNLVLRKYGKQLYDSVKSLVSSHLLSVKDQLNAKPLTNDVEKIEFLKSVSSNWEDHLLSMRMISDVLMYLDRVYAKENRLPLIYDAGVNLFRDDIIKFDKNRIGTKLNILIVEQITANRNGLIVDIFLIKSIINMFEQIIEDDKNIELGETYYTKIFEPYYLEKTLEHYEKLSSEIFDLNNGTIYLKRIDELITNEQNKSALYLPKVTYPKLSSLIDTISITSNIDKVMKFQSEGLKYWIQHNKTEELKLLYKLLSRVSYFEGLDQQLKDIILDDGESIDQEIAMEQNLADTIVDDATKKKKPNNSSKKATQQAILWIDKIILLKDKYDLILKNFKDDALIQKTVESAFATFINKNAKLPEYLSLYIDDNIKKTSDKSEEYMENMMNKAITIFRFIKDKDLFEKYYKNHLAKRLLKNPTDYERTLIAKFKNEIGSTFTSKFEGMFRDINLSKEISKDFNVKSFEVNVLTKTFWPIQPSANSQEVILSSQLQEYQESFNDYYIHKHNGRNLSWAYNFGSIDIRIKFDKKVHELNMSLYCGIIILLFEEHDELTFEQIELLTRIPKVDLTRSLQSVAVAPRTRILTKKPMSKDIRPGDLFKFNSAFTAPMTKVKILTVASKVETDSERSQTVEKVEEERKFELDAAIVRIMKSRKSLSHNELVVETFKQIQRFNPSPQFIKRRINELLEREYLQRDRDDRSIYHYLA